jgi:hypothetical protein
MIEADWPHYGEIWLSFSSIIAGLGLLFDLEGVWAISVGAFALCAGGSWLLLLAIFKWWSR